MFLYSLTGYISIPTLVSNLWVGVGIALAAPVVLPVIGAVVRPLAKVAIRGSLATAEVLTPVVAGAAGQVGKLLAEPIEQFRDLVVCQRYFDEVNRSDSTDILK